MGTHETLDTFAMIFNERIFREIDPNESIRNDDGRVMKMPL